MNTAASAVATGTQPALIGEDEFWDVWGIVPTARGDSMREFDDAKQHPINNVWTIVDSEAGDGALYALPGFHVVNQVGYVITKKAWTDDGCEAVYMEGDPEALVETDEEKTEPLPLPPHIPTV